MSSNTKLDQREIDLVVQLLNKKKFKDAKFKVNDLIKKDPGIFFLYNLLGIILSEEKNINEAIVQFKKAIQLNSNYPEAYNNLGIAFFKIKEYENAKHNYEKAISLKPGFFEAHNNLGAIYRKKLNFDEAVNCYNKSIQLNQKFIDPYINLGNIFNEYGKFDDARKIFLKVIELNPNYSKGYSGIGRSLKNLGNIQQAIENYEKAIQLEPNNPEAYNNLGVALRNQDKLEEAIENYKKAIQIDPKFSQAYYNLGVSYQAKYKLDDAIDFYKKTLEIDSEYLPARSNLIYIQNYSLKYNSDDYLDHAKKFYASLKKIDEKEFEKFQFEKKPNKLRVGFVSGDFRKHPVGYILKNILGILKNSSLEIYAYSNSLDNDDLTEQLKSEFKKWDNISFKNDIMIINKIRSDKINILFDLSGYTGNNKLSIFINKPAPVQITWLGCLSSTGIPEIDYIIGDPYTFPKDLKQKFTEKIWRFPEVLQCFSKPNLDLLIGDLPTLKNNFITFGCFSNPLKINNFILKIWSKILNKIPNSKIMFKSLRTNDESKKNITNSLVSYGVNQKQIIFDGKSSLEKYFESYNKIDLVLDTFPFNGGATSHDAVWMGVPVLSLQGNIAYSRMGSCLNHHLNMIDWIAKNEDEYIIKATKFASDSNLLSNIRKNLRQKAIDSPIFNSERFAKNFEENMWKIWNEFIK